MHLMKIGHIARLAIDLLWKRRCDFNGFDIKGSQHKKEGKIVSWSSEIRLPELSILLSSCVPWFLPLVVIMGPTSVLGRD